MCVDADKEVEEMRAKRFFLWVILVFVVLAVSGSLGLVSGSELLR